MEETMLKLETCDTLSKPLHQPSLYSSIYEWVSSNYDYTLVFFFFSMNVHFFVLELERITKYKYKFVFKFKYNDIRTSIFINYNHSNSLHLIPVTNFTITIIYKITLWLNVALS